MKSTLAALSVVTTWNGPHFFGGGRPRTSARNTADALLSRAYTIVWLKLMDMPTSLAVVQRRYCQLSSDVVCLGSSADMFGSMQRRPLYPSNQKFLGAYRCLLSAINEPSDAQARGHAFTCGPSDSDPKREALRLRCRAREGTRYRASRSHTRAGQNARPPRRRT